MNQNIDHGQQQQDFSRYAGGTIGNILPVGGETEEQDPFHGEVPNDSAGYAAYKRFYEGKMERMMKQQGFMQLGMNCEDIATGKALHHQLPDHAGSNIVIACNHVIHQDPHNPEGVKFLPFHRGAGGGLYLCMTCMRLEERKKLNWDRDLNMKCAMCVLDTVMRINSTHPDRLINLGAM